MQRSRKSICAFLFDQIPMTSMLLVALLVPMAVDEHGTLRHHCKWKETLKTEVSNPSWWVAVNVTSSFCQKRRWRGGGENENDLREWCGGLFFLWALLTLENCYSIMQIRSACALKLPSRIFYMCYYHRFGWFSHTIFEHQYIGNSFVRTLLARLLIWKWSLNCYKHHWLLQWM